MARKPTPSKIETLPPVNTAALHEDIASTQAVRDADLAVIDALDIYKAVGRIEASQFYATVSDRVIAETFVYIKNSKKYKGLPYKGTDGNTKHVSHLDEFCEVFLHRSARRVQQLADNLHTLGADLYEQAEQIGFRARDYQALKALPPEDQDIIKQAIESQDRDAAIDLMQEMAVRHAGERQAQQRQIEEAQAEHRALDKLAAETAAQKRDLQVQLEKLQLRTAPWSEKTAPFKIEISERQAVIDEAIVRHQQAVQVLDEWLTEEITSRPDYHPEAVTPIPEEVLSVLLHLDDAVQRCATLVGAVQHELRMRFGEDIDAARQHLLRDPQQPSAVEQ